MAECSYCQTKRTPDYKNYEELGRYLTSRTRIVSADRSGLCSKHQRRLTREIKRARHLGLLGFSPKIE